MTSKRKAFAAPLIAFIAAMGIGAQARTVSAEGSAIIPTPPIAFVAIQPCRLADTRPAGGFTGPFGPPALVGGATRVFPVAGNCGIPMTAQAVSMNLTVTLTSGTGHLSIAPDGSPQPVVSTLNYVAGQTVANNVTQGLGTTGGISVFSLVSVHFIIDVNGYFLDAIPARPIRVTPTNLGVWEAWNDLCGLATIEFTNGEAQAPPLGTGSFQVTATDGGNGGALATQAYDGTLVSALTALRYSTRSQEATDQPYIYINLSDVSTIYFIPANNVAGQGAPMANTWQTWNALTGLWNLNGNGGPLAAVPLSTFGALSITGVRIASGCGASTGGLPRARATDDFEIGVSGAPPTIYDFERN
jgi:hypothetical protein